MIDISVGSELIIAELDFSLAFVSEINGMHLLAGSRIKLYLRR